MCSHVAAVLFKVVACIRLDVSSLTFTSLPCVWNQVFSKVSVDVNRSHLKTSEWLGSLSCCVLEIILANHNWDRCRSQNIRFDPNPGVLFGDDYKNMAGQLIYAAKWGKQNKWDKRAGAGNMKMSGLALSLRPCLFVPLSLLSLPCSTYRPPCHVL